MRIVVEAKAQQSDDAESLVGSRCSVLCGGVVLRLVFGHLLFRWHFRERCRKAKEVSVRIVYSMKHIYQNHCML